MTGAGNGPGGGPEAGDQRQRVELAVFEKRKIDPTPSRSKQYTAGGNGACDGFCMADLGRGRDGLAGAAKLPAGPSELGGSE